MPDLQQLQCWLEKEGITHVVMESTGSYWKLRRMGRLFLTVLIIGMLASEKNTASAVQRLIAKTNIPVVCTYQGAGVVPREHLHRFGGRVGLFRT